tara:strand:- start:104823 stop:105209 length:387 start_codon:yes stop_codon:yes gene_type:complete
MSQKSVYRVKMTDPSKMTRHSYYTLKLVSGICPNTRRVAGRALTSHQPGLYHVYENVSQMLEDALKQAENLNEKIYIHLNVEAGICIGDIKKECDKALKGVAIAHILHPSTASVKVNAREHIILLQTV